MGSLKNTSVSLPCIQSFLDDLPVIMQLYRRDGLMVATNRMSEQFWRAPREILVGCFNMLEDPQNVSFGIGDIFRRVAKGETITIPPVPYDTDKVGLDLNAVQVWVEVTYIPVHNDGGDIEFVGVLHRDVTNIIERERGLKTDKQIVSQQLTAIEQTRRELELREQEAIKQRETILSLSSPISQVWDGILTMPLIGDIDEQRAATITERLLESISFYQSEVVILDVSGVPIIDGKVAAYLISAARACLLLGCEVVLVGISADVAQTIVHLGIDLSGIVTRSDLQGGLTWALRRLGMQVVTKHAARQRVLAGKQNGNGTHPVTIRPNSRPQ